MQLAELISKEGGGSAGQHEELSSVATGTATDEQIATLRKTTEERQSRITQKASAFLSPDQLNGLQTAFREENDEQESSLKFVREMRKGANPGAPAIHVSPKVRVEIKSSSSVIPAKP